MSCSMRLVVKWISFHRCLILPWPTLLQGVCVQRAVLLLYLFSSLRRHIPYSLDFMSSRRWRGQGMPATHSVLSVLVKVGSLIMSLANGKYIGLSQPGLFGHGRLVCGRL